VLKKLFKKPPGKSTQLPKRDHKIKVEQTSKAARDIIARLQSKGHEAYMVGGCIRDLLSGIKPKDYDVATSATPEQVVRLFPRARMIGRRFRIVHVRQGRELIEVTTFRAHHTQGKAHHGKQSSSGILVRDNVFGSLEEDAMRRDFTCNSFYYDPSSETLFDMCGGFADLKNGILRTIGDPYERFREDPVRMLRAIRFESKLGLRLDESSQDALSISQHMMAEVSPARLFDEVIKVLMTENADSAYQMLVETRLFDQLFPASAEAIEAEPDLARLIELAMQNTVDRIKKDKGVAPFFLYAALLWPPTKLAFDEFCGRGMAPYEAMEAASRKTLDRQAARITIPKRFAMPIAEVWKLQTMLPKTAGRRAAKTAGHTRFRAAYDFLLLREESGEETNNLGQWWTEYQETNPLVQDNSSRPKPSSRNPRRRKRSNRSQNGSDNPTASGNS
jgi:poly(A) polymerase